MSTIANVRNLTERLARESGLALKLEAWSPGDGTTRYIVTRDGFDLIRGFGAREMVGKLNACLDILDAVARKRGKR